MARCVRYLIRMCMLPALGVVLLFAAAPLLVPLEFLETYYTSLPIAALAILFVYGATATGWQANLVLSLGARRHDLFHGTAAVFVLTSLLAAALIVLAAMVPGALGMTRFSGDGAMGALAGGPAAWPMLWLACLTGMSTGGFSAGSFFSGTRCLPSSCWRPSGWWPRSSASWPSWSPSPPGRSPSGCCRRRCT